MQEEREGVESDEANQVVSVIDYYYEKT